ALALLLAALVAPAAAALAQAARNKDAPSPEQGVTRLGDTDGWSAYLDTEKNRKICYLLGEPSKSEPAGVKRAKIFASVTHRPHEKVANEVSFNAGYLFKEGSDAELLVDGKKFSLFTNKDSAWSRDAAIDKLVVEALAKGKQAVLKGTSTRGTATTDIYTLAGFTQALAQIDKACGVKR
ncbi:MAG: invasion associated locus B family protein, partial [Stellaceae bacterium]